MYNYDRHYFTLSDRLERLRKQSGYSLAKFELEINYAQSYISRVEKGGSVPSIKYVGNIAKFLDISVDILLFGNDNDFNEMLEGVEVYEPIERKRKRKRKV